MDAEALRTFLAIHQTGGISSGATKLGRSQPAISRRIALLEEELGVPLFERVASGVVLSQAGHVLLPHAQRVLAALDDCRAAVDALHAGEAGPVSLAIVGTLAGASLTPVLKRFSSAYPDVDLRLQTANSKEVSELVRGGEMNLGLRYHNDSSLELDCREIMSEPLKIVCSPSHKLAGQQVSSLRVLEAESWLAFPGADKQPETSANNLFAQFQLLGIAKIKWTAIDSITAQKRLVEAGYGLAVLPISAIEDETANGLLTSISVAHVNLANPIFLVTRRGGFLSAAATAMIEMLRQTKI